jgi:hypothetical protein
VYAEVISALDKPFADESGSADVVMLDHQSAHGPESNLDPNDALRQARGASKGSSGRILSAAPLTAIVRIQTNCWLLRRADAM